MNKSKGLVGILTGTALALGSCSPYDRTTFNGDALGLLSLGVLANNASLNSDSLREAGAWNSLSDAATTGAIIQGSREAAREGRSQINITNNNYSPNGSNPITRKSVDEGKDYSEGGTLLRRFEEAKWKQIMSSPRVSETSGQGVFRIQNNASYLVGDRLGTSCSFYGKYVRDVTARDGNNGEDDQITVYLKNESANASVIIDIYLPSENDAQEVGRLIRSVAKN